MKRLLPVVAAFALLATRAFAADVDSKLERAVRESLPVCSDATLTWHDLPIKLPARLTGKVVVVDSKRASCTGQFAGIVSPAGGFYFGMPWPLDGEEGKTAEEKLKNFSWRNLQESVTATIDRTKLDENGLYHATLWQVTEFGKMPLEGSIDPDGKIFFFGTFRRLDGNSASQRSKAFGSFLSSSPAKGAESAPVTVVEFSDFQCPSCRHASGYLEPILAAHPDQVRYVRYDVPLSGHSWAFAAALAGRAIYRQKPEVFWDYKKQIYANQDTFNSFTFWDWARGFAEDHDLDLKRYDADLQSQELKDEILKGEGAAFANDVRATPTYMVNGAMVDPGDEGKALAAYVDSLLAKK